jgi:hypothetical protein
MLFICKITRAFHLLNHPAARSFSNAIILDGQNVSSCLGLFLSCRGIHLLADIFLILIAAIIIFRVKPPLNYSSLNNTD